ncbi:MAG: hypothetical protein EPN75_08680 [Beijerinckiaceae bacterium]|nr:MAG: hypothetical protein EPN75_08680 [Beijerinckiaceae bacterium]
MSDVGIGEAVNGGKNGGFKPDAIFDTNVEEHEVEGNRPLVIDREMMLNHPKFKPNRAIPPGAEEALSKPAVAQMIYVHAMRLFDSSYDKASGKFSLPMNDALDLATIFFIQSWDDGLISARSSYWSKHFEAIDPYSWDKLYMNYSGGEAGKTSFAV